jgi:hypothetical protein
MSLHPNSGFTDNQAMKQFHKMRAKTKRSVDAERREWTIAKVVIQNLREHLLIPMNVDLLQKETSHSKSGKVFAICLARPFLPLV